MKNNIEIVNLKCGGCANTIINRLCDIEHISDVEVDNDNNNVTFNYNSETDLEKATNLLSKLGYPIVGADNPLTKKAKSFVSCAVGRMNK